MGICKSSGSPKQRANRKNLSFVRFSTVTPNTWRLNFGRRLNSCTSLKHRNDDSSLSASIRASLIFALLFTCSLWLTMASPEIDFHLARAEGIVSGNFGTLLSSLLNSHIRSAW